MLEMCVNQGAGLQSIAPQAVPRVMAMASHGDQQGELPLLWRLCATLTDFGYPVVVLDATALESEDNPGLEQLLDNRDWRDPAQDEPVSWSVLPAGRGLCRLGQRSTHGAQPLEPLGSLLARFSAIVIYARAEVLAELLADSELEPLLTVSPVKMSPVTAYQALKQMLLTAKLRPTIASLVSETFAEDSMVTPFPVKKLQECAMHFLGYRIDALAVHAAPPRGSPCDDMTRLALRLLEKAMPLQRNPYSVGSH